MEQRRLLAGDLSAQLAPEVAHRPAIAALVSPDPGMESSDAKEVTTFYRETQDLTGGIGDASLFQAIDPVFVEPSSADAPQFVDDTSVDRSGAQVLFIDARVGDIETLVAGAREDVEVVIIDTDRDGLQQIADYLDGRVDLAAVHIVSHGSSGQLLLGSSPINNENLAGFAEELSGIGNALAQGGDLLFYGCNVGEGARGAEFLDEIATLTGRDIAASTDLTGAAFLGGDWELEAATGTIDVGPAFEAATLAIYSSVLDARFGITAAGILQLGGFDADDSLRVDFGSVADSFQFQLNDGVWHLDSTNPELLPGGRASIDASGRTLTVSNAPTLAGPLITGIEIDATSSPLSSVTDRPHGLAVTSMSVSGGGDVTLGGLNTNIDLLSVTNSSSLSVNDVDGITLGDLSLSGNLAVTADGDITDADGSITIVGGNASFTGRNITLGDDAGDSTNFGSLSFAATGAVGISEDSDMHLIGANSADDLSLSSTGRIINNSSSLTADVEVTNGNILGGEGPIAGSPTVNSGGTLAPGNSPGEMQVDALILNSGSTFEVEIDGSAPTDYDRVVVSNADTPGSPDTADVTINNSSLSISLNSTGGSYNPQIGEQFTIIQNEGTDPIGDGLGGSGTFAGLAEGALFTAVGETFSITYVGGDGNDVVLTVAGATGSSGEGNAFDNRQEGLGLNYIIALNGVFPDEGGAVVDSDDVPYIGEIKLFAGNFAPEGYAFANGQLLAISSNTALFSILGTTYGGDGETTFALPDLRGRIAVGAGDGPGLSRYVLGQSGGAESVTLSNSNLPTHSHTLYDGSATTSIGSRAEVNNLQPYLAINYMVRRVGAFQDIGEIGMFAGNFAPPGWELAEGQLLAISRDSALFTALGTTYGGDGRTTFALPDLRGRVAVSESTSKLMGARFGGETNVLLKVPEHAHDLPTGGSTASTGVNQSWENRQPSLVVNATIIHNGTFPTDGSSGGPAVGNLLGEVELYAVSDSVMSSITSLAATNASTNGDLLPISSNPSLFSILGTMYGGDGRTTLGLPNLDGRAAVHSGNGPGLSWVSVAQMLGADQVTLTETHLPAHAHSYVPPQSLQFEVSGGDLQITGGSGASDNWNLVVVGDQLRLLDANNGNTVLGSVDVSMVTGDIHVNGNVGDDSLTVDVSILNAGIDVFYDGGTGGNDMLSVIGDGTTSAIYRPDVAVHGNGFIAVGANSVKFSNLEPVDISGMMDATLVLPGGDDVLTIAEGFDDATGTIAALIVSGTSGGVAIEQAHLFNNTNVTIDTVTGGSDGDDVITISGAANDHGNTNLTITTGAGLDSISGPGNVALTGNLALTAKTVDLNGNINAGANLTVNATDATFDGTIDATGDVTVTASGETRFNAYLGSTTALGSLTVDGGGTTFLNTGQDFDNVVDGNATFTDAVALQTNTRFDVDGDLTFDGTVDSTNGGQGFIFSIGATDSVTFNDAVGGGAGTELGSIATGGAGIGTVNFNTDTVNTTVNQTYNDAVVVNPSGGAAGTITFNASFAAGGPVTFNAGLDSATDGQDSVIITGNKAVLAGTIGGANRLNHLTVNPDTDLNTDTTISAAGTVTFNGAIDSQAMETNSLAVTADTQVNFNGTIGGSNALNDLDITTGGLNIDAVEFAGAASAVWTTDQIDIGGAMNPGGGGTLTIAPRNISQEININTVAGLDLHLSQGEINLIDNGFDLITIGDVAAGTGSVLIDPASSNDSVSIAGGAITVNGLNAGSNDVTLTARINGIVDGGVGTDIAAANVVLTAANGMGASDAIDVSADVVAFSATAGVVQITDSNGASFSGTSTSNAAVNLTTTTGNLTVGAAGITTNSGAVTLQTDANDATITLTGNVATDSVGFGGEVNLRADNMQIVGTINTGDAEVNLRPNDNAQRITVGGADSALFLGLSELELDRITTNGELTIGSGQQSGILQVVADLSPNGVTGGVTLQTLSGEIDIAAVLTASSRVTLSTSTGDINFDYGGRIHAIGETVILTTGGAIRDGDATIDIVSLSASFTAGTGIGALDPLDTQVTNLAFNNAANQTNITNTGALIVFDSSSFGEGGIVRTGSSMAVNASVTSRSDYTLEASGDAADNDTADTLTINANVTHTGAATSARTITLRADDNVVLQNGTVSFSGSHFGDTLNIAADSAAVTNADANLTGEIIHHAAASDLTAANIHLSAGTGIGTTAAVRTSANAVTFANTSDAVRITESDVATFTGTNSGTGITTLTTTSGNLTVGTADIVTNGGTVTLNALASGASVIILDDATDGATISTIGGGSSGAAITIVADDLDVQTALADGGAINSGAGLITIQPTTADRAIMVGTNNASRLGITDSELDRITSSGGLTIGSGAQTGNITMSGAISPANLTGGTFLVQTGGAAGIAFAGAGIVTSDVAITFATNTGEIEFAGGSVTTSDATITFEGDVRLSTGNSPISTGAGPGNVLFNGTVNSVDSSFPGVYRKLTVNAGTGTVQFAGLIGNASDGQLTDLDVTASLTTFIAGTVRIDAENRLTDTVTITGDVRLDGNVVFDLDKNSVRDSSLTITGTINADDATNRDRTLTVNAGEGTVSFGSTIGADQQLADLDVTASTIYLGGNVTVNDGSAQTISLTGNVVLTGDVAFDLEGTNDHHLHVSGTTVSQASQANDLQINTGATGDASFAGTVGSGTDLELGKITVNKTRTVTFDSAVEAASFVQAADSGTTQLAATGNVIDSTTVDGGTLQVTGSLDSTTTLNEGILDVDGQFVGSIVVNGGTLKGTGGTVTGAVTVKSGGTIAPGNSPGIIHVGDLSFTDGATFAVEIDDDNADDPAVAASKGAVAGTDYDQVQVVGAVSIGANVTLDLQDIGSSESNIGDVYTIIANDAEDAISGSFAGLRDNAVIATGVGVYHQISYAGGDGNDVTLTRVEVGTIGDLVWNDLDGDGIRDAGEPGLTGVTVYIDSNSNGTRDGGEPSEVTDSNGAYSFIELVASTYNIHVEPSSLPAGSVLSKGDSGYNVSLGAGEDFEDADFGVVPRRNVSLEVSASVGSEADGTIITVTARADGAVAGNQTVDLSVSGPGGESSDFTLSGTQIQIPHGQTSGSVTFTILDDDFAEATEQATLTISNPSIGVKIVTAAQEIEIQDNDEAGIAVSPTAGLITTETGATDTFTVRLTSQPRQSVTVNVTSGDATEGFVAADGSTFAASTSITIDPSQWNVPQTITVKGQDDGSPDGTVGYTIQSQATSSDPDYQGLSGTDVAVSNQDDEPALEFQQVLDERVWLTVNRITPDGIIIFAWGTEAGTTHVPQYGVTLGIADATLVSLSEGGTDSTASGYIPIPFTTAGQRYLFQAFEMAPNPQVTGVLPLNIAGAPVSVTANNSAPELTEDLPSFTAAVDKPFDFKIADDSFVDPDSDGELFYTARQTDGSALPQWLGFNPADLSFHSDAIPESGQWSITVTATDSGTPVRFSSTTFVLDALADQSIWQNQMDSRDVNGDGQTTPFDALIVLNRLNTSNNQSLATQRTDSDYLIDVNGDQSLTPIDALRVINWLNRSTQGVSGPVPHAITDPKDEDSSNIQPATLTVPVRVPKVGSTDQSSVASVSTSMPNDPIEYEENPNDDQRQGTSDYEAIVDQIFADGF
ncbi:tail fiber protein [Rosistilla oblonga]|uniref:tail fiber protein n=1 Tax=Rosistilla oblonga TaxID=2527990 RepID=UPI003A97F454